MAFGAVERDDAERHIASTGCSDTFCSSATRLGSRSVSGKGQVDRLRVEGTSRGNPSASARAWPGRTRPPKEATRRDRAASGPARACRAKAKAPPAATNSKAARAQSATRARRLFTKTLKSEHENGSGALPTWAGARGGGQAEQAARAEQRSPPGPLDPNRSAPLWHIPVDSGFDHPTRGYGTKAVMEILQVIGHTSLVRLRRVVPPGCAEILVKLESENPPAA